MSKGENAQGTIPVSIITGFLGAGKTTLLNRLLASPAFADSAVIINEFGEVGLDHLIVATPAENTVLLKNGCLCCTVQGELTETLVDLHRRRADGTFPPFARVLVETTGLADPVPILQSLLGDDEIAMRYRIGSVTTVVDAVNGPMQLEAAFEAAKQLAVADRVVLSKTDIAPAEDVARFEKRLAALNPGATIVRAVNDEMAGDIWVQDFEGCGDDRARSTAFADDYAGFEARVAFRHGDVRTFLLTWPEPVRRVGLHTWLHLLASFKGPDLLRMKGIVNVDGAPVLINAVQRLIHEPVELAAWPSAERDSRIVFITRGIDRADIEPTLAAFGYRYDAATPKLDPNRYANFVSVAQNFRIAPVTSASAEERSHANLRDP